MQPILTVLRLSVRDRPSEVANLRQASLERGGTLRVVSLNHITAATRTTRTLYTFPRSFSFYYQDSSKLQPR